VPKSIVPAFSILLFLLSATGIADDDISQRFEWSDSHRQRTRANIYRDAINLHFFGEAEAYAWYRVETGPETNEFVLVDTAAGSRTPAFDHAALAADLSRQTDQQIKGEQLPFEQVEFSADATQVTFAFKDQHWTWNRETNILTPNASKTSLVDTQTGLPALDTVRSSGNGDPTEIEITNQTDAALEIFWVDGGGQRISYGTIQPGASFQSSTYVSHAWVLVDGDGKNRAAFQAGPGSNQAYVNDKTPVPNDRQSPRGRNRREPNSIDRNSPDGSWTVFYRNHNVVLRHRQSESEAEYTMTESGTESDGFGGRVMWAPNSKHFVVMRTKRSKTRQVTMIDSAPDDQLQPRQVTINYAKPGDELDIPRPYLFDVPSGEGASKQVAATELAHEVDNALFSNPFQINRFAWKEDSSEFTFVYNQRGHEILRVIGIDAATAKPRTIIDEQAETFVCYSQKFFYQPIEQTDEILWMTERSGWNHLVLIDAKSGEVKAKTTDGPWVVREVERVDESARQVWLKISGYHADQDPYHVHLARVDFDGGNLTLMTTGDGTHDWQFSADGNFIIDRYSRVDLPPVTNLIDASNGRLVCELERADWSELLETGWIPPERFVAKGRDGETDIWGIIIRPTNFDPGKRYPILESIYAGPHSSFTPKSFGRHAGLCEMADMGFVIVKLDGMGTSDRSKAFHDVCWKNLGDSGFLDRIAWMRAAAEKHPELDLQRVGIWGGSAGGQSALRALLAHGDFYRAAAADCGCHDNRMDKIWWNEQWMGWPVGPHYEEQSNVTQAHRLTGDLLLTVGELDTNVDPASTMQVVDALIKADKDFELIVFPGAGHGIGSGRYGTRRMKDFFVRSLGNPTDR
jgi:dipeptidyl aminopeptidase/acylaminoacyl peptidase